jgi:hypothetical protein
MTISVIAIIYWRGSTSDVILSQLAAYVLGPEPARQDDIVSSAFSEALRSGCGERVEELRRNCGIVNDPGGAERKFWESLRQT